MENSLLQILDFYNPCPRALGRKTIPLSEYAFKLKDSPLPTRSAKLIRSLKTVSPGQNLKNMTPDSWSEALTLWNLEHFSSNNAYLAATTVRQAYSSAITHLRVLGYNSKHVGTTEQQKVIIDTFIKNLTFLSAGQSKDNLESVWSPEIAHTIYNNIDKLAFQSRELNHPSAPGLLPNIIVRRADSQTVKASLLWLTLTTGLRSSELYQISLKELFENRHMRTLNIGSVKVKVLVTYSRIKQHKTSRLGVDRFTPFIVATNVTGTLEPTMTGKVLAYLLKISKLRTYESKVPWDSPVPPTRQFIANKRFYPYTHTHLTAGLKNFAGEDTILRRSITANATRRTTILAMAFMGASNEQIQNLTAWRDPDTLKIYLGRNLVKHRESVAKYPEKLFEYFQLLVPVMSLRSIDMTQLVSFEKNLPQEFLETLDGVQD